MHYIETMEAHQLVLNLNKHCPTILQRETQISYLLFLASHHNTLLAISFNENDISLFKVSQKLLLLLVKVLMLSSRYISILV